MISRIVKSMWDGRLRFHNASQQMSASRSMPNQLYCIFLFVTGAFIFGILISHLTETYEADNRLTREMEDTMEPFLSIKPRYHLFEITLTLRHRSLETDELVFDAKDSCHESDHA